MADLPIGTIIIFDGATIPENWAVCDGTNGTPNLIDKFIRGANSDTDNVLSTGGTSTHAHTITVNSGGSHTHSDSSTIQSSTSSSNAYVGSGATAATVGHTHSGGNWTVTSAGAHGHTLGTIGSSSHIPTYIQKCFIMKIA